MEDIKQMRERHKKEIEVLQASCAHENVSDWMPYEYAPGHRCGEVRICGSCGKIVDERQNW